VLKMPRSIWQSMRALSKAVEFDRIHLVHSNTLAVFSGAIWSSLRGIPHVWHVHEIIERPAVVRKMFGWLLRLFASEVVCNSHATMNLLLQDQPSLKPKITVVWNGIEREVPVDLKKATLFRKSIGVVDDEVLVVLMGRINRWKGQGILVEAAGVLVQRGTTNLRFVILGSPPAGQEHYLHALEKSINESVACRYISLIPFTSEIWGVWDACDIAVVPSTEPEPFGMVALEAMCAKKPVVAACHGGLAEIVVDKQTGVLFEPRSVEELADAIAWLGENAERRNVLGNNGYERVRHCFSLEQYVAGISGCYDKLCG